MPIAVGQKVPHATFKVMKDGKVVDLTTQDVFAGKTVALFAVPGAYTPTCHAKHVPSFVNDAEKLKGKGVDLIACTAVNDAFVLAQWAKDTGAAGKIEFLADGSAEFARAIGMDIDLGGAGLGVRSKRYAMVVKDGTVAVMNTEANPGVCELTSAAELLKSL
ncbi:MAG: peroxiredoxin [Hyphomicrobiaceae bacterium]